MSIKGFNTADGIQYYSYNALDDKPFGLTGETHVLCEAVTLDAINSGWVSANATAILGTNITLSVNGVSTTAEIKEFYDTLYAGNLVLASTELEDTGESYLVIITNVTHDGTPYVTIQMLISDYAYFGITEEEPDLTQYTATVTIEVGKLLSRSWLEPEEETSNFRFGCLCYPGSPSSPSGTLKYIDVNGGTYTGLLAACSLWQDMRETGLVPVFIFNQDTAIALPSSTDYRNVNLAIPMISHIGGPGNFRGVVVDSKEGGGMYYFTIFDGYISFESISSS